MRKTDTDFNRLATLVTNKYDLNHGYEYHIKTSFVYFDDAEREMEQIIMLKDNEPVIMTPAEWETIKVFYRKFVK